MRVPAFSGRRELRIRTECSSRRPAESCSVAAPSRRVRPLRRFRTRAAARRRLGHDARVGVSMPSTSVRSRFRRVPDTRRRSRRNSLDPPRPRSGDTVRSGADEPAEHDELAGGESAVSTTARARSQVSTMSGAAALFSSSVSSTVRASIQVLGISGRQTRGHDPAAHQLPDRVPASRDRATPPSAPRGHAQPASSLNSCRTRREARTAGARPPRRREVALLERLHRRRRRDPVGRLPRTARPRPRVSNPGQRRHDHDGRIPSCGPAFCLRRCR